MVLMHHLLYIVDTFTYSILSMLIFIWMLKCSFSVLLLAYNSILGNN